MKIREANRITSKRKKVRMEGADVAKSIEKAFRQSVRPTWQLWEKDMKVSTHGTRSAEKEQTASV